MQSFPPIPAPPGKYLLLSSTGFSVSVRSCHEGHYCALARTVYSRDQFHLKTIQCPENTFCSDPTVLEPTICGLVNDSKIEYCPEGSYESNLCPEGYYCTSLHVCSIYFIHLVLIQGCRIRQSVQLVVIAHQVVSFGNYVQQGKYFVHYNTTAHLTLSHLDIIVQTQLSESIVQ
jgi:hypothetical protein